MSFKQHKKRWVSETFNVSTVWVNPGVDTIYCSVKNADGGGGGATLGGAGQGGYGGFGGDTAILRADLLVSLSWRGAPGGRGGITVPVVAAATNADVGEASDRNNSGDGPAGAISASGNGYNNGRNGFMGKIIDRFPFPANGQSVTFQLGAAGPGGAAGSGSGQNAGNNGFDASITIEYEV